MKSCFYFLVLLASSDALFWYNENECKDVCNTKWKRIHQYTTTNECRAKCFRERDGEFWDVSFGLFEDFCPIDVTCSLIEDPNCPPELMIRTNPADHTSHHQRTHRPGMNIDKFWVFILRSLLSKEMDFAISWEANGCDFKLNDMEALARTWNDVSNTEQFTKWKIYKIMRKYQLCPTKIVELVKGGETPIYRFNERVVQIATKETCKSLKERKNRANLRGLWLNLTCRRH